MDEGVVVVKGIKKILLVKAVLLTLQVEWEKKNINLKKVKTTENSATQNYQNIKLGKYQRTAGSHKIRLDR